MLYRKIEQYIKDYLNSNANKVLIIDGARQIGKTFIIDKVGKDLFDNFIEINLLEDSVGDRLFANVSTVEDFYLQVSMIAGASLDKKENTLIFLDEIQAYPQLLTILKFLKKTCFFKSHRL